MRRERRIATLLNVVQQLIVGAEGDWMTVYHDQFTEAERTAPTGAIVRRLQCIGAATCICFRGSVHARCSVH